MSVGLKVKKLLSFCHRINLFMAYFNDYVSDETMQIRSRDRL